MGSKSSTRANGTIKKKKKKKSTMRKKITLYVRRPGFEFLPYFCFSSSLRQRSVEAYNRHELVALEQLVTSDTIHQNWWSRNRRETLARYRLTRTASDSKSCKLAGLDLIVAGGEFDISLGNKCDWFR